MTCFYLCAASASGWAELRETSTRAAAFGPVPGNGRAWQDWSAGLCCEDHFLEVSVVPTGRESWLSRDRTRGGLATAF